MPNELPKQPDAPVSASDVWKLYPGLAASVGVKMGAAKLREDRARRSMKLWLPIFLAQIAHDKNVNTACMKAGIPKPFAYRFREENPHFAEAWDSAVQSCIDSVEAEVIRRARDGVLAPVYQAGHLVGYKYEKSDTLAGLVLKAHRQELYNVNKTELTGKDGAPMQMQSVVVLPPVLSEEEPPLLTEAVGETKTEEVVDIVEEKKEETQSTPVFRFSN